MNDYAKINWQWHASAIVELEKERETLLNNNDLLTQLERNKEEVLKQIEETRLGLKELTEKAGGLKSITGQHKEQVAELQRKVSQVSALDKETWYKKIEKEAAIQNLQLRGVDNRLEEFIKRYNGDAGELRKLRGRQRGYATAVVRKMMEIKEHSKAEYSELAADVEARAEYIKKFEVLNREDLKRHEERFNTQLNTNVIQSISVFDNQLLKHEADIKQKIKTINLNLEQIEYNTVQDTYITILMDPATHKEIRLFREDLRNCYTNMIGKNSDLYTEEKYEQVKAILDRFASMEHADREWTAMVTDVRQWYEFNASERYRVDNTEKEFYEGSGGKSGGQKEKLAYTILASALAYQFGLQIGDTKSRSFRFVVIDEAFGKGSDESTRYGLELFRKLDLQLLIVTPLQKIHVIENHVNSFHFVSNQTGNNSQVANLTYTQYMEEKEKRAEVVAQPSAVNSVDRIENG